MSARETAELAIAATKGSQTLGAMPDYPHALDESAREGVASQLAAMCASPQQVEWVVQRALTLFRSWKQCGAPGLRQILVSKFHARDGIECGPEAISEGYPEGIPGEKDGLTGYQIASGLSRALLAGPAATQDARIAQRIENGAARKRLPMPTYALPPGQRPRRPSIAMPKLPPPSIPEGKEITQADIEAELKKKGKQGEA